MQQLSNVTALRVMFDEQRCEPLPPVGTFTPP